jgi:methyl-accepting chemotaxis protein
MFDERLRETLENISSLPPLRVGEASHNIRLQHTLSLLLLKRALENKKTYIDIDIESIKTDKEIVTCLKEIRDDLEDLLKFNKNVKLFEEEILKDSICKLIELIDPLLRGLNKIQVKVNHSSTYDLTHSIEEEIERRLKQAKKIGDIANELNDVISSIDIFPLEIKKQFSQLVKSIALIFSKV